MVRPGRRASRAGQMLCAWRSRRENRGKHSAPHPEAVNVEHPEPI